MNKEIKVIAQNKKANHDYFIEDTYEAGLVLTGTEIKSIRRGRINLKDSYCQSRRGEMFVYNMHISHFEEGNRFISGTIGEYAYHTKGDVWRCLFR